MGLQHTAEPETAAQLYMDCGYTSVLKTVKAGILSCVLDEDLTILWANDAFYERAKIPQQRFEQKYPSVRMFYKSSPNDFAIIRASLVHALEQGQPYVEMSVRIPQNDGPLLWPKVTWTIAENSMKGHNICYAVYQEDALDADKASRASQDAQVKTENFQWMLDEYVGNVYVSDMETYELLFLNQTSCETLGVPMEKVLGLKCYKVIQGRDEPCPFCTNHCLKEGEFYEWEFYNPMLDRTFLIKDRMIQWKGRAARLELSHDNYSLEYKLEKKDRERESILRTIPGGFMRIDAQDMRTVLWYGAGFLQMIGYTKEQFGTELQSQCAFLHPDDDKRMRSVMKTMISTRTDDIIEVRILTREGQTRVLTATLSYVDGESSWDGKPSFYSVGIDVTRDRAEQSRQRMALEDAYKTARAASSAKTNFLSTMSHDIRTPMNAIMGMAAIAKMNVTSPDKVNDCLNKINVSSRHLLNLINEVLDMSKIESGKIDLMLEDVDLSELVQNVSDICRPLIAEKRQQFNINVGQVRHEKLVADGERLQQVFMNLLSNAMKYTPEGGTITLRVNELYSPLPKKGQFEFIFIDDGIGMSKAFVPHIFEPFSRAEDSRISKIQGTGLGMAITENIVRMMNGSIEVQSEPGKGSKFTVSVPLELHLEDEPTREELFGLPVLVVDDDQMVCENAAALLNELGMRGYWVLSGAEAVRNIARAHREADDFYAVILDWKMPEMDGLQTVRAIREELGEDVPIIIISAYDYGEIENEFLQAGADAFITKPLFKSKMLHVLQLFCTNHRLDTASSYREDNHPSLRSKRILLAEDNDLNREIAVELLQMQNLHVDTVENGKRAVEVFEASAPGDYAAVLMDIQMPVMNGYDAARAIRALERSDAREIPILALTANAFADDVSKARSAGMNDHIAKPIDMDCLMKALQLWVN